MIDLNGDGLTSAEIDVEIHKARIAALERQAKEAAEWVAAIWTLIPHEKNNDDRTECTHPAPEAR